MTGVNDYVHSIGRIISNSITSIPCRDTGETRRTSSDVVSLVSHIQLPYLHLKRGSKNGG